jgi:hypothetical protein
MAPFFSLVGLLLVHLLAVASPGPAFFNVSRHSLRSNRRSALAYAGGTAVWSRLQRDRLVFAGSSRFLECHRSEPLPSRKNGTRSSSRLCDGGVRVEAGLGRPQLINPRWELSPRFLPSI